MTRDDFIAELGKLKPSCTFLNLHKYRNEHGEVADFNIIFHINYENALRRSLATIMPIQPENGLQAQAKDELIKSFQSSLSSIKDTYIEDIDDAYIRFMDEDDRYIKGVKMHAMTGDLHIYGLVHQKVVHVAGSYKTVNKRPLTIEKDKLRSLCVVNKFRQFKIVPDQLDYIKVNNLSLLPPIK